MDRAVASGCLDPETVLIDARRDTTPLAPVAARRTRIRPNRPSRSRIALLDHHRTRRTGLRRDRHQPARQRMGHRVPPTPAWSPPSSTASPSTPTSSRPAPSPTDYAPAKPPPEPNEPAEQSGAKIRAAPGAKSLDETHARNEGTTGPDPSAGMSAPRPPPSPVGGPFPCRGMYDLYTSVLITGSQKRRPPPSLENPAHLCCRCNRVISVGRDR